MVAASSPRAGTRDAGKRKWAERGRRADDDEDEEADGEETDDDVVFVESVPAPAPIKSRVATDRSRGGRARSARW